MQIYSIVEINLSIRLDPHQSPITLEMFRFTDTTSIRFNSLKNNKGHSFVSYPLVFILQSARPSIVRLIYTSTRVFPVHLDIRYICEFQRELEKITSRKIHIDYLSFLFPHFLCPLSHFVFLFIKLPLNELKHVDTSEWKKHTEKQMRKTNQAELPTISDFRLRT